MKQTINKNDFIFAKDILWQINGCQNYYDMTNNALDSVLCSLTSGVGGLNRNIEFKTPFIAFVFFVLF